MLNLYISIISVNELKSELKKRNLTVSGAKPQLIERLRPHLEALVAAAINNNACVQKLQITPSSSGTFLQPSTPSSPTTFVIVSSKENSPAPANQQPGKISFRFQWGNCLCVFLHSFHLDDVSRKDFQMSSTKSQQIVIHAYAFLVDL